MNPRQSSKGMTLVLLHANRTRRFAALFLMAPIALILTAVQARSQANQPMSEQCRFEAVDYKGWHAQQLSNRWVQLIVVPQNGGRLMQVSFAGHAYMFVGSIAAATNSGSCRKATTTNNIGWATPTCWTMGRSPFESFRKDNAARSNSRAQPIPGPGSSLCARFAWTPIPRASAIMPP